MTFCPKLFLPCTSSFRPSSFILAFTRRGRSPAARARRSRTTLPSRASASPFSIAGSTSGTLSTGPMPSPPIMRAMPAMSMSGLAMRWPIQRFSAGRPRCLGHAALVPLVVVERAVVAHDHQARESGSGPRSRPPCCPSGSRRRRSRRSGAARCLSARAPRRPSCPGPSRRRRRRRGRCSRADGGSACRRRSSRAAGACSRRRCPRVAVSSAARHAAQRHLARHRRQRHRAAGSVAVAARGLTASSSSGTAASGSHIRYTSIGGRPWWSMLQPRWLCASHETWMILAVTGLRCRKPASACRRDRASRATGSRRPRRSASSPPAAGGWPAAPACRR